VGEDAHSGDVGDEREDAHHAATGWTHEWEHFIGAEVVEARLKELEGRGLPARLVYAAMKTLVEKHAKTSKNFWD
jgi:hypothetical protein